MKLSALLLPLATISLLSGCTATAEPAMTKAESCEAITASIAQMMATFEDQTASEGSVRMAFSNASATLATTAGSSEGELADWATELSILSSKLAQAIADGDGDATVLTVNDLFASFANESEYCG
jgi:hypothetical protein